MVRTLQGGSHCSLRVARRFTQESICVRVSSQGGVPSFLRTASGFAVHILLTSGFFNTVTEQKSYIIWYSLGCQTDVFLFSGLDCPGLVELSLLMPELFCYWYRRDKKTLIWFLSVHSRLYCDFIRTRSKLFVYKMPSHIRVMWTG